MTAHRAQHIDCLYCEDYARANSPTGDTVRKADRAMARTRAGLCPVEDCARPLNEDGECDHCRRAE